MIITHTYPWKSYKVDLADFYSWLMTNAHGKFAGISANSNMDLHFTAELTENEKAAIDQYWNALTEAEEATKLSHKAQLDRAVAYATTNLPYADFAALIPAEKKIWMHQALTLQDKEDLLAKYPNV